MATLSLAPIHLLSLAEHHLPLLGQVSGRQLGPVTAAIRAMRADEPLSAADAAIQAIRDGLDSHFAEADRQRLRDLRKRIADRVEFDVALLDALDGEADREDSADAEPWLGSIDATSHNDRMNQLRWSVGGVDEREMGDRQRHRGKWGRG